jgi:hypothetical protein
MSYRAVLWIFVVVAFGVVAACGANVEQKEIAAVRQVAVKYLDAEKDGNLEKVYGLLAPSSDFRKNYSYDQYRLIVADKAVRLADYDIREITGLNSETGRSELEMTADVLVLVRLFDPLTGLTTERETVFTFVKEKGVWYKG